MRWEVVPWARGQDGPRWQHLVTLVHRGGGPAGPPWCSVRSCLEYLHYVVSPQSHKGITSVDSAASDPLSYNQVGHHHIITQLSQLMDIVQLFHKELYH